MIPGARVFFGSQIDPVKIILLYVTWVLLLAGPFYLVGRLAQSHQGGAVAAILLLEALTPIGLASPLLSAGAIFPSLRWLGLLLALIACVQLVRRSALGLLPILVVSILAWIFFHPESCRSFHGKAVHTQGGGSGFQISSVWDDYPRLRMIADQAQPGNVIIFPENTIHFWIPEVSDTWLSLLLPPQATVIFGAEYPLPRHRRQPVVLVRGAFRAEYRERFPVPVAMWGNDTPLHYFGSGSVRIGSIRAGVLLCYEQLLPMAAIETFAEEPSVLLAPANLYWAAGTTINQSEDLCVRAWAQLFNVPYYRAVNE
jgi:hypothetical protein